MRSRVRVVVIGAFVALLVAGAAGSFFWGFSKGPVVSSSSGPALPSSGGVATIGGDVKKSTITTAPRPADERVRGCHERLRVRGVHLLADQPCVDLFDVIADLAKGKYYFNKPQSAYVEEPFRVVLALPTADGQDMSRVFRGAPGPVEEREAHIAQYLLASIARRAGLQGGSLQTLSCEP